MMKAHTCRFELRSVFMVTLLLVGRMAVATSPLDDAAAYWKLDESSGTFSDEKGAYPLTPVGSVFAPGGGYIDGAATFAEDGDDTYAYNDDAGDFGVVDTFSVSTWIYINQNSDDEFNFYVGRQDNTTGQGWRRNDPNDARE